MVGFSFVPGEPRRYVATVSATISSQYQMPQTETVRDDRESPTLVGAIRNGVWSGLKWTTIIVGPFLLLGIFVEFSTISYRVLFLSDTGILDNVSVATIYPILRIFPVYFLICFWGMIIGVSLSLIRFIRP